VTAFRVLLTPLLSHCCVEVPRATTPLLWSCCARATARLQREVERTRMAMVYCRAKGPCGRSSKPNTRRTAGLLLLGATKQLRTAALSCTSRHLFLSRHIQTPPSSPFLSRASREKLGHTANHSMSPFPLPANERAPSTVPRVPPAKGPRCAWRRAFRRGAGG